MTGDSVGSIAITGASGYLGRVLCERFEAAGWSVVRLGRAVSAPEGRRFELGRSPDPDLLADVDVLVHCAYDMTLTDRAAIWKVNVDGARELLGAAQQAGVRRTIVLSSMSAYEGTSQLYGSSKLDIEGIAAQFGAVSVRPGLVYGPHAGGMAGSLTKLTTLPVVPVVASRSHQFTVHEDDFADAVEALVSVGEVTTEPIGVASPHPVSFRHLVEGLARLAGRSCRTVPVNWHLVYAALRTGELLRLPLPFRADSLLGLVRPAPSVPNLEILGDLGVVLRRFDQPTIA